MDSNDLPNTGTFSGKPVTETNKDSLIKSIFSIALFIGAYYLFFSKDLTFILLLVLVLFVHEMGHFVAMKIFGYADVKMFFIPLLGALVTGNKNEISQKQRAIVLLAGPVPGIIAGIVLYVVAILGDHRELIRVADIFLFVNGFNLLPIVPLDGGNLMDTLYFGKRDMVQIVFMVVSAIGMCLLAFYLSSYVLLIIPFFLITQVNILYHSRKIKMILDQEGVDYRKPFEQLSRDEYIRIRQEVISNMPGFKGLSLTEAADERKEKRIDAMIKTLAVKKPVADLSGLGKLFFLFVWFVFLIAPLIVAVVFLLYKFNHPAN